MHNDMMRKVFLATLLAMAGTLPQRAERLWVEAEAFTEKGGWVVDQQFMDEMGSPYLLAHGLGVPVADAETTLRLPVKGTYYVFVRTFNWTSPWQDGEGPGKFWLLVDGKKTTRKPLGANGREWMWQEAGRVKVNKGEVRLSLHDLTGFDGRVDAIYLTTDATDVPPAEEKALTTFRRSMLGLTDEAPLRGTFDLVVCGAGTAGISAAASAARLGLNVALVNDRPVLGGNNSSEIRVHTSGRIGVGPYKKLGDLQKEFNPRKGGNAQPAEYYEDERKLDFVKNEPRITLFLNYHINRADTADGQISSVTAQHIETGEEIRLEAPLFCDCTGDGTVGYLAGADYRMGREARDEFHESRAPEVADSYTLGASVMWYSVEDGKPSAFPEFDYGMHFTDASCQRVKMGEWTWETGMTTDKTRQFERVRDYGMLVIYANWSYLKHHMPDSLGYRTRSLGWVAYMAGKRESRRLMGDYILKQDDVTHYVLHEDGTAAMSWPMDLHYPDPKNTQFFPGQEFKTINKNTNIHPYPIPYRCLYSRNVDNLFMAGRCISVSHVVHGSIRVMRTTGMMGEVVGMAASLCKRHGVLPRAIYRSYFPELKQLMEQGVGKPDAPDNQKYNEPYILPNPPELK